jgi:holo-[acyl-carrier protein] synthase
MAILGVGLDVVELERVARIHARHGDAFVRRFCHPEEVQARTGERLVQHLGGLFAAKEAVLKALGTGWAEGLGFLQVRIERAAGGRPAVRLEGAAGALARRLGVEIVHLSITHETRWAAAVAVLEGPSRGPAPG